MVTSRRTEKAIGNWMWWRLNRDSFQRDQEEDDRGFDKGSSMATLVTMVLLIVGIVIAFALAARGAI